MPYTMTLVSGAASVTLPLPEYGYDTELHMPICVAETHPYGYAFFDADTTGGLDYRITTGIKLMCTAAQQTAFNAFLRNPSYGRAENVTLSLGATSTGFFPFGPDLGDVGNFIVRVVSINQSGALYSPLGYFSCELTLALVTPPATPAAPAQITQGNFAIGTVSGLMPPQRDIESESMYNFRTDLTRTGVPTAIDGSEETDSYEASLDVYCNVSKAVALCNFLKSDIGRAAQFDVSANGNYLFGADSGISNSYLCNFLGSSFGSNEIILNIRHESRDRWIIPVRLYLIGYDIPQLLYKIGTYEMLYKADTYELLYKIS